MRQFALSIAAALVTYGALEAIEHLFGVGAAIVVCVAVLCGAGWILVRK